MEEKEITTADGFSFKYTYSICPLLQSTHYQFEGHATSGNWTDVGFSSGEGSDLKCLSQALHKRGPIRIPQIRGISMQNKYKDHT